MATLSWESWNVQGIILLNIFWRTLLVSKYALDRNCLWFSDCLCSGIKNWDLFLFCPQYFMLLPFREHIVNHHVKIWHVRLEGAYNMHPLSWGRTNGKDRKNVCLIEFPSNYLINWFNQFNYFFCPAFVFLSRSILCLKKFSAWQNFSEQL